jgi:hypothetical protein
MVKIQIPSRDECARGFAALIRRGRVDCYADNTFIIPEPGLQVLQEIGVSYIELGRGGLDYAQKTLRELSATVVTNDLAASRQDMLRTS